MPQASPPSASSSDGHVLERGRGDLGSGKDESCCAEEEEGLVGGRLQRVVELLRHRGRFPRVVTRRQRTRVSSEELLPL